MKTLWLLFAICMLSNAFAGDCIIHIKRVACKGKEKDSYAKCNNLNECYMPAKVTESMIECAKLAKDECINIRKNITKSKEVTATFNGESVMGKNFCKPNRPDFNKCE
jgi:hypothetical protein